MQAKPSPKVDTRDAAKVARELAEPYRRRALTEEGVTSAFLSPGR